MVLTNGKYFQAEAVILSQTLPRFYCLSSKPLREGRHTLWHYFTQCCLKKSSLVSGFYFPLGASLSCFFMHAALPSVYDTGKVWWPLFPLLPSCPCSPTQSDSQAGARIHPQALQQALEKVSNSSLSITARLSWAILSCPCSPWLHASSALRLIAQTSPGWHHAPTLLLYH